MSRLVKPSCSPYILQVNNNLWTEETQHKDRRKLFRKSLSILTCNLKTMQVPSAAGIVISSKITLAEKNPITAVTGLLFFFASS